MYFSQRRKDAKYNSLCALAALRETICEKPHYKAVISTTELVNAWFDETCNPTFIRYSPVQVIPSAGMEFGIPGRG